MIEWGLWPAVVASGAVLAIAVLIATMDIGKRTYRAFALFMTIWSLDLIMPTLVGQATQTSDRMVGYTNLMLPIVATNFALCVIQDGRPKHWSTHALQPTLLGLLALGVGLWHGLDVGAIRQPSPPFRSGPLAPMAASQYFTFACLALVLSMRAGQVHDLRCRGLRLVSFALVLPAIHYTAFFLAAADYSLFASGRPAAIAMMAMQAGTAIPITAWAIHWFWAHRDISASAAPVAILPIVTGGAAYYTLWAIPVLGSEVFFLTQFGLLSLWSLVTPAIIAFSIIRYRFFDIELKAKFAITQSTLAGLFATIFLIGSEVLEELLNVETTAASIVAAVAIALALRPLHVVATRFANRLLPGVDDNSIYRAQRAEELYAAAYESAIQDGAITEREARLLTQLRRQLQLPDDIGSQAAHN